MEKVNESSNIIMWIAVITTVLAAILQGIQANEFFAVNGPSLMVVFSIVFTFIHAYKRYGLKSFFVFLGIVFVIGNIYENMSIATTFPFGPYHYTDSLGPKFIFTPLIINIAYFQMIYIVWNLAGAMLDYYDNNVKGKYIIIQPIVATFVMVMWDLTIDPFMSTISEHWVWHNGGAYYGVPLQNYYGWYLCTFTMFVLFSIYMSRQKENQTPSFIYTKTNWLRMVICYLSWPLVYALMGEFAENYEITALNNQIWMSQDIMRSSGLIGIGTMGFVAIFVIMKIFLLDSISRD